MFKTQDPLSYFQMVLVTRNQFLLLCVIAFIRAMLLMMSLIYLKVLVPIFPVAYHFAV